MNALITLVIIIVGFILAVSVDYTEPKPKIKLNYLSFKNALNGEPRCAVFYLSMLALNKNASITKVGWQFHAIDKSKRRYCGIPVGGHSYFAGSKHDTSDSFIFYPEQTLFEQAEKGLKKDEEILGFLPVSFPNAPAELLTSRNTKIIIQCYGADKTRAMIRLSIEKMTTKDHGFPKTSSSAQSAEKSIDMN